MKTKMQNLSTLFQVNIKQLFIVSFIMLTAIVAQAQNRTVTGTVTDEKGAPLASATIAIKGTSTAVVTDTDGKFNISVPTGTKSLTVSYVGYETSTINLGSGTNYNLSLVSSNSKGEEVVVVGYGSQRKRDVTSSVATIGANQIRNIPVQSFEQALQGKAAGLNITIPNGVLNNPPVMRIRGVNSISGSSFPLVVVDGVPLLTGDASSNLAANNALGNINPADIEDVQILKDAAAAAIYGSRAANGVMLITTKKGKQGAAKVSYDVWAGYTEAFNIFEVLGARDYVAIKNEAIANANYAMPSSGLVPGLGLTAPAAGQPLFFLDNRPDGSLIDTRWADEVYQRGMQHSHNISVSGANAGTRYYFSANYTNQEGILQTNTFNRKQMRMNLEQKVNNWLKIGGNFSYSRSGTQSPSSGSLPGTPFNTAGVARLAFLTAPNISPYLADGSYNYIGNPNITYTGQNNQSLRNSFNQIGRNKNLFNSGLVNPVMVRDLNKITSDADNLLGDISAEVKLYKGLTFRTQYGVNWTIIDDRTFYNSLHGDGIQTTALTDDGRAFNTLTRANTTNFQNVLNYNTTINNSHNLGVTIGTEENAVKQNGWGASRSGLSDVDLNDFQGTFTTNDNPVGNFITENYLLSYFGRVNYNFNNKYYLSLNARRDGFSAFAEGKKWGNFGGISGGWNISDEEFYKGRFSEIVNKMKLRASYGSVGNISAVGNFASLALYGPPTVFGNNNSALGFSQAENKNLTWEKSQKLDVGLEMSFLKNRITTEIGYYRTNLSNLILPVPTPPSMGIPNNSIVQNSASMYNKGIEILINAKAIVKKNFSWNVSVNLTTQKNEVTKLDATVPELVGTTQLERTNITRPGYSIGSFFLVKSNGVDPTTGKRIFVNKAGQEVLFDLSAPAATRWVFRDGTTAPAIDLARDGYIAGNALPKVYGGIINNFSFKNFDLNIDCIYSLGNSVYFGSRAGMLDQRFWNNLTDIKNRWTKPGDVTDIPKVVFNDNISNGSAFPIDANLFNANFLRFRNIALGYSLPTKVIDRIKLSNLRVYAQAQNPFIITKYPGSDPEISVNGGSALTPGVDRNTIGQSRVITFGINVGF
jgi:TonB-dependent starch-binding outer membrane protein SusC